MPISCRFSTEYETAGEDLVRSLSELVLDNPLPVECTDGGGLTEEVKVD